MRPPPRKRSPLRELPEPQRVREGAREGLVRENQDFLQGVGGASYAACTSGCGDRTFGGLAAVHPLRCPSTSHALTHEKRGLFFHYKIAEQTARTILFSSVAVHSSGLPASVKNMLGSRIWTRSAIRSSCVDPSAPFSAHFDNVIQVVMIRPWWGTTPQARAHCRRPVCTP